MEKQDEIRQIRRGVDSNTPELVATDARGLVVRTVAYNRCVPGRDAEARICRHRHDAAGRARSSADARRLAQCCVANFRWRLALSGRLLREQNVDAGWRMHCFDAAGCLRSSCDARATRQRRDYDALGRLVAIHECLSGEPEHCVERLAYGNSSLPPDSNMRGRLLRHDDPGGTIEFAGYSLTGTLLGNRRRFLATPAAPHWPAPLSEREGLLEPCRSYLTRWHLNAVGTITALRNAAGHTQAWHYTLAAQADAIYAWAAAMQTRRPAPIAQREYDAAGRLTRERMGNGAIAEWHYEPATQRLARYCVRVAGSAPRLLRDTRYCYDPVGNVTRTDERAQVTLLHDNQRIQARSSCCYDSSYQLIEASGREVAPGEPGPGSPKAADDATRLANYTRTFRYDAAGNLICLRHRSRASHASFSRSWIVAAHSNRAIQQNPSHAAVGVGRNFDAHGNLLELQPGQTLEWNARNQLRRIAPVCRATADDDSERYVYDGQGHRIRKVRIRRAKELSHREEVRYLPGLELRDNSATGERLQVSVLAGTGIRLLRWEQGRPPGMPEIQARYSLRDQLGSSVVELDDRAQTVSYEEYYPFGGTALWAPVSALQAKYKSIRYSGKERDATGLYAYGFRYYAPWLGRWLNPDPAGLVDGPNLFRMARNNPLTLGDPDGRLPVRPRPSVPERPAREPPPLPARHAPAAHAGAPHGDAGSPLPPAIPPRRREAPGQIAPSALSRLTPASAGARMHAAPTKREVFLSEMVLANGAESLFTRSLSDCTAVAVLSDRDPSSGIWRERYLGHLAGSNLQMSMTLFSDAPTAVLPGGDVIQRVVDRLTPGGIKVILGFGTAHESAVGRSITMVQEFRDNLYPLARLLIRARDQVEAFVGPSLAVSARGEVTFPSAYYPGEPVEALARELENWLDDSAEEQREREMRRAAPSGKTRRQVSEWL